jgi:membrane protease YdiL (CAAX protease family)
VGSPGATGVWLLRLALQGILLAYAVYRTRSFWWSTGYHAGWNWASAPLFGAAGSGYLDQGHLLDFTPTGPTWITGDSVGPEGSVFAYLAMLAALGLLIVTTRKDMHFGARTRIGEASTL